MNTMHYDVQYKDRTVRPTVSTIGVQKGFANLLVRSFTALVLAMSCLPANADPLLTYPLRIGEHSIRAELANTPQTRRNGLMFRRQLASSSGMIFVFPGPQRVSM